MKKSQAKTMFVLFLIFVLIITSIYAVTTRLLSPGDNFVDDDGYLDLRGSCEPLSENSYDGTTSWNVTNATLYSNVNGNWSTNKTLQAKEIIANSTYFFNFTNYINQSAEGDFRWNIQCNEQNSSGTEIVKGFAGNNTIKVIYALPDVSISKPGIGDFSFNGLNITVVCTGKSSPNRNLTRVDLYTNINGDLDRNWTINQTYVPSSPEIGQMVVNFSINTPNNASLPEGELILGCSFTQQRNHSGNGSFETISELSTLNRSVFIEFPPTITANTPTEGNWSKSTRVGLNYTVSSTFTSDTEFTSRIWTNDTGIWSLKTGSILAKNNTDVLQEVVFLENSEIVWSVEAIEKSNSNVFNFSTNRTIRIDTINPVVSSFTIGPNNNSVEDATIQIIFTPNDANLALVKVLTNLNGLETSENYTNRSSELTSGEEITVHFANAIDQNFNFSIVLNDSSGRITTTTNYTVTVDVTFPDISRIMNISVETSCTQRNVTWDTNETTNFTFYLDTDTDTSDGTIVTSNVKELNHSVVVDFNFSAEITHFFNITSCDVGGNCNTSGQITFDIPASICTGWSQYSVYDARINLSDIQNQSGADLVYFWNQTKQDWVFLTAGLSANGGTQIGKATGFHVVHLFENTNSTWFRNTSNVEVDYRYNVTSIHNWISVPGFYNFGNLTESFMNSSKDFPAFINLTSGDNNNGGNNGTIFGPFNLTAFAGYNNTATDYVSHLFNFTVSNASILEPCPGRSIANTCMEVFWVASSFNVSWNGTQIYSNWTI